MTGYTLGRVKDQYWDGYGTTADVDRFKYAHDDAGNRTYRDIDSAIYSTDDKDQAYSYDGLHRLTNADEGTLSGETISGTPSQEEDYTLDALGNWSGYVTKTSGTADLDQSRTHNDVNEITDVAETTGPSWATPAHDAAGNMLRIRPPTVSPEKARARAKDSPAGRRQSPGPDGRAVGPVAPGAGRPALDDMVHQGDAEGPLGLVR